MRPVGDAPRRRGRAVRLGARQGPTDGAQWRREWRRPAQVANPWTSLWPSPLSTPFALLRRLLLDPLLGRANPLQRDARSNLPLHLCCAIDDRAVAGLLAAQPEMGAHSFEGYGTQNRRHVTPLALCDASGGVAALVAKLREEAARLAQAAEERLRAAGGTLPSIDSILRPEVSTAHSL